MAVIVHCWQDSERIRLDADVGVCARAFDWGYPLSEGRNAPGVGLTGAYRAA